MEPGRLRRRDGTNVFLSVSRRSFRVKRWRWRQCLHPSRGRWVGIARAGAAEWEALLDPMPLHPSSSWSAADAQYRGLLCCLGRAARKESTGAIKGTEPRGHRTGRCVKSVVTVPDIEVGCGLCDQADWCSTRRCTYTHCEYCKAAYILVVRISAETYTGMYVAYSSVSIW